MADNVYKLKFKLSDNSEIDAGNITVPQGEKGDKGDPGTVVYSASTPLMDGTASTGTASAAARGDHRHPTDTSRQEKLVSGTTIKTINGQSLLGSGNIAVSGEKTTGTLIPESTVTTLNLLATAILNTGYDIVKVAKNTYANALLNKGGQTYGGDSAYYICFVDSDSHIRIWTYAVYSARIKYYETVLYKTTGVSGGTVTWKLQPWIGIDTLSDQTRFEMSAPLAFDGTNGVPIITAIDDSMEMQGLFVYADRIWIIDDSNDKGMFINTDDIYSGGYDGANAVHYLNQGNVKTLFGNQSIYGSGNIDLYRHNIEIKGVLSGTQVVYCVATNWSSSNTNIDSLTDLFSMFSGTGSNFGAISGWVKAGEAVSPICTAKFATDGIITGLYANGSFIRYYFSDSTITWTITDTVTTV